MPQTFDCTKCGACCWTEDRTTGHTVLTPKDIARLPPRIRVVQSRHFKLPVIDVKPRHGGVVCMALDGTIGKHVGCAVYRDRPQFCRDYPKPGDTDCRERRKRFNITT